ncbi:MAG TPA: ribonuclease P protein component [Burkholderiaceae bacterium]
MPGGPRAASGSRSESGHGGARRLGRTGRLRRPAEFAALLGATQWRAARRWVAASAAFSGRAEASGDTFPANMVRFGFTVPKRHARRAVERAMVKRILREGARHAAPGLAARAAGRRVDLVLRLKAALPGKAAISWHELKRTLRSETDELMSKLEHELAAR